MPTVAFPLQGEFNGRNGKTFEIGGIGGICYLRSSPEYWLRASNPCVMLVNQTLVRPISFRFTFD